MKKRAVSFLLAVILVVALFPAGVMADGENSTATIEAYNASGEFVSSCTSIDAAAQAAGVNGKVKISEGVYYFNGRQTISVPGVTVEGAGRDKTVLYASSAYSRASATNKKALLTIGADNVTVTGLALDGSIYGDTLSQTDDFIVIRINEGSSITLNDVAVSGSKRTLIHVGTSSSKAAVNAENLYCDAYYKTIPSLLLDGSYSGVYADIEVNSGSSLTVGSGTLNAFAKAERGSTLNITAPGHYELRETVLFGFELYKAVTTAKHFVYSYDAVKNDSKYYQLNTFKSLVTAESKKIDSMATDAIESKDTEFIEKFIDMLSDVIGSARSGSLVDARARLLDSVGSYEPEQPAGGLSARFADLVWRYSDFFVRQISSFMPDLFR